MTVQIHNPKAILVLVILLLVGLVFATARVVATRNPHFYANCTEAYAHHDANIPSTSPYYRPALDRNHDGVACQQ